MPHFLAVWATAVLFVVALAVDASPRHVSCSLASLAPNPELKRLYTSAFRDFEDSAGRGGDTLSFESDIVLSLAAAGSVDLGEAMVTLRSIELQVNNASIPLQTVLDTWQSEWSAAAARAASDAATAEAAQHNLSAASAHLRAWAYGMAGERMANHLLPASLAAFRESQKHFVRALALLDSPCSPVSIPFEGGASLAGYWCKHISAEDTAARATILLMNGYDGTAEISMHEVAFAAMRHGYNVLVFEGPGQGSVARFQRLLFRPDWETVVSPVAEFAVSSLGAQADRLVLWGESFGGQLAPAAFNKLPSLAALVANGGVVDFFQAIFCGLQPMLQDLYYSDRATFDRYMGFAASTRVDANFLRTYGELGFNTTSFSALFDAFQAYYSPDLSGVGRRPVLVYDPALDTLVRNQSSLFFEALPRPLAPSTALVRLDPKAGGALHCGVGSTRNAVEALLARLDDIFPASASRGGDGGGGGVPRGWRTAALVMGCALVVIVLTSVAVVWRRRILARRWTRGSQQAMPLL